MKALTLKIFTLILILLGCSESTIDDVVLPMLEFSPLTVEERDVRFTACVNYRLSERASGAAAFTVGTEDGTAEAGTDYVGIEAIRVELPNGTLSGDVCVEIIGDTVHEEDEYFYLVIREVEGTKPNDLRVRVTIENDDTTLSVVIPEEGYMGPEIYPDYELLWRDEFDEIIDPDYWVFETGNGQNGWGNAERQYYRSENASIVDGHLVVTANNQTFGGFPYTSSRLKTQGKFAFKYGRVDVRAAMPYGQGIWPAVWMLGQRFTDVGWPHCGEIDIVEMIGGQGRENTVHGTAHWQGSNGYASYGQPTELDAGSFHGRFHVFSIEWTENEIRWYVDKKHYNTLDITPGDLSEFHDTFFLIINLAVGGRWPGYPDASTEFPQHLIVDYIRVFQAR